MSGKSCSNLESGQREKLFAESLANEWNERQKVIGIIREYGAGKYFRISDLEYDYNQTFAKRLNDEGDYVRVYGGKEYKKNVHFHYHIKQLIKDNVVDDFSGYYYGRGKAYWVPKEPVRIARLNVGFESGCNVRPRVRRKVADVYLVEQDSYSNKDRHSITFNTVEEAEEKWVGDVAYSNFAVIVNDKIVGELRNERYSDRPFVFVPEDDQYDRSERKFYTTLESFWKHARQHKLTVKNRSRV
jgi:hypothetical protein